MWYVDSAKSGTPEDPASFPVILLHHSHDSLTSPGSVTLVVYNFNVKPSKSENFFSWTFFVFELKCIRSKIKKYKALI